MGHVVKYIMGEKKNHPKYEDWTIEQNADGKVHIHLKNMRMDLTLRAYNQFYEIIKLAHEKISKS